MVLKLRKKLSGAVLVVTLILLVLLTLIGLESMETITVEEIMAYNYQDKGVSFQSAEEALLEGEKKISNWSGNLTSFLASNNYVYDLGTVAMATKINTDATWTSSDSICLSGVTTSPCPNNEPRYIIIVDQATSSTTFYVFARGVGSSGKSVVLLRSTYQRSL